MIVKEVGQMIGHQILARDSEIDWIPILKLSSHFLQFFFCDAAFFGKRRSLEKDVIPDLVGHLLRADLELVVVALAAEGVAL